MSAWIDAFAPTFGLIGLGFWLSRISMRDEAFWAGLERLGFFVLLPALLATSIATVRLSELPVGRLAATLWTTLLLGAAGAICLARSLGHGRAAMTSVLQGGIRFDSYMALAIAGGLYGPRGLALAGVVSGLIVPFVQVILTLVFVISDEQRLSPLGLLRQIALNPLLLGCLAGFLFSAFGGLPPGLGPFVRTLGQASLATGLLCVGAGLMPSALREEGRTQLAVGLQKLVVVPALTLLLGWALGLDPMTTAVATLVMAMPTAVTSFVMARAMGGDARLMAATVTLQHVAAVLTIPLWALALAGFAR